jgi:hypothetical protein
MSFRKSFIFNFVLRSSYFLRDGKLVAYRANSDFGALAYFAVGNKNEESLYSGYSVASASDVVDNNLQFLVHFHR